MNITLFVPVLNEIEGLQVFMPQIPKGMFNQILIVDGQSKDASVEWCRKQGYDVYVQKVPGIRNAYIEAWPMIKNDYVLTFSPDGNCKTEDLPLILDKLKQGYDMVIASRYLPPAKSEDDGPITGFGNWMFTKTINTLHGGKYTDAMTIYRGYRTKLFYDLDLHKEESYSTEKPFFTVMGIEPLLSVRALKRKLKIAEVPSDEPKRMHGVRKLQIIRWGSAYLTQILKEKMFWR